MKSAEEFKKQRNKKYNDWIEFDEKVKGQWKLIESIVDKSFNSLGHSQKYIDISNVGDLYKENERKLISEPNYFKITKDKNGIRLYFDEKDYNDYLNNNKNENNSGVKQAIKKCTNKYSEGLSNLQDDINSKRTENLKNNSNEQVKDCKKDENLKAREFTEEDVVKFLRCLFHEF